MKGTSAVLLAVVVAGVLPSAARAQHPGQQPSPGYWQEKVYRWSYNPLGRPAWLDAEQARQLLVDAAREWEVCGIRIEYAGETDRPAGVRDGLNVVGWRAEMPRGVRGITQGAAREGRLLERDITLASARTEFQRFPTLLRKVAVHEFGHAIGLTHSAGCNEVMTLAADCPHADPLTLPQAPTAADVARCRALYMDRKP